MNNHPCNPHSLLSTSKIFVGVQSTSWGCLEVSWDKLLGLNWKWRCWNVGDGMFHEIQYDLMNLMSTTDFCSILGCSNGGITSSPSKIGHSLGILMGMEWDRTSQQCMYVCIYIYVCMYVCLYIYVYIYMYVCMYVYICICMYVCMYACILFYWFGLHVALPNLKSN